MRKTKHRLISHIAADFMLSLIANNLIPAKTRPAVARPAKLPKTNRHHHRVTPTRETPMLFSANFNFDAAAINVAKLVDRHGVRPMEVTGIAASAAKPVSSADCLTN